MIKILCVNGSPRREKSSSFKMLSRLIEHAESFGGECELIHLCDYKILPCEGCYSKSVSGEKCVFPCIHNGLDDTMKIIDAIIKADALAIATPVYWAAVSSAVKSLQEKITCVENNADEISKKIGREPLLGKPVVLIASQDGEGASLALSQTAWALNHMGFLILPWSFIFRPSFLDDFSAREGLRIMGNHKFEWIENTIRLAARNLVLFSQKIKDYQFDDDLFNEPRD